jgi:ParB family chromosome partitioning protein
MSRQALGRGLESLIPLQGDPDQSVPHPDTASTVGIDRIVPNPFQPRQDFDPQELEELASSVLEKGIIQPILVRPKSDGQFEVVAGERRWRAAKLAGLAQVPVVIRTMEDAESLEIAIIENVQRSDLNPVEEALAYQQLISEFSLTQEDVAQKVGKNRSSVSNTLRLLKLPQGVLNKVRDGRLSEGHARALLSIEDIDVMERLADKILRDNLSVRETEKIAGGIKSGPEESKPVKTKKPDFKDPHTRHLEDELKRKLGTQVKVSPKSASKGKIEIDYYSLEDLDRIISILG